MIYSVSDNLRREFFNNHADGWMDMFYKNSETGDYNRFNKEFSRLFSIISLNKNDTVLDAGCGCGVLVPHILDRIGIDGHLYELDYAEKMIEINKRLHNDLRIDFLTGSVEKINIPSDTVDAVICFSCFPHFERKNQTLLEFVKILKQNGSLTIAHFDSAEEINNRHSKHISVKHDHLPSESEMRSLLDSNGFRTDFFTDETGFYCITAMKK